MIAVGADQELAPYTVGPGEIAFGYVYFDGNPLPQRARFRLKASIDTSGVGNGGGDLVVSQSQLADGRIVGIARNMQRKKVTGPIQANAMCFSLGGRILSAESDYLSDDAIATRASSPFQIELLHGSCPIFLVAVGGFLW